MGGLGLLASDRRGGCLGLLILASLRWVGLLACGRGGLVFLRSKGGVDLYGVARVCLESRYRGSFDRWVGWLIIRHNSERHPGQVAFRPYV